MYYGFQFECERDFCNALYFEKLQPPENLPLVGNFLPFNQFDHLTENTDTPISIDDSSDELSQEESVSEKSVKRLKQLNGENSETKDVTCGDCKYHRTNDCEQENPKFISITATYAKDCSKFEEREI
jgi:hypothetical protein